MYWKAIRWGGSLIVILLVVAAALTMGGDTTAPDGAVPVPVQPAQPAEAAPQPNKNFNL